jgi:hypothetical protein
MRPPKHRNAPAQASQRANASTPQRRNAPTPQRINAPPHQRPTAEAHEEMPQILRLRGVHRTIDIVEGEGTVMTRLDPSAFRPARLRESIVSTSSTTRQLKAASSTHEHSGQ